MAPNVIAMDCSKCKVAGTCPKRGSSPTVVGRKTYRCQLVGGYGRVPVDTSILSDESARRAEADGPCLTLAQVPVVDESGTVSVELVKVFSRPVLHGRETTREKMDVTVARSTRDG